MQPKHGSVCYSAIYGDRGLFDDMASKTHSILDKAGEKLSSNPTMKDARAEFIRVAAQLDRMSEEEILRLPRNTQHPLKDFCISMLESVYHLMYHQGSASQIMCACRKKVLPPSPDNIAANIGRPRAELLILPILSSFQYRIVTWTPILRPMTRAWTIWIHSSSSIGMHRELKKNRIEDNFSSVFLLIVKTKEEFILSWVQSSGTKSKMACLA